MVGRGCLYSKRNYKKKERVSFEETAGLADNSEYDKFVKEVDD
ncbi:hypothetical protein PPNK14_38090 [Pectobacterium parmentieri]